MYQESVRKLGLVQEVEKNKEILKTCEKISRCIRLNIYNKYGVSLGNLEFVKPGAIITTSSGKIIRSQRLNIKNSAFIYRERNVTEKELI